MNPLNAEQLFHEALGLPSREERTAFLKGACAGNAKLLQEVQGLLDLHERAGDFLPSEPGDRVTIELPAEAPGSDIGRYKLLQKIGEGGMGVVYMAEQTEPVVRKVALKIIKLGMDTRQVVARFEAERQALAMMDHPNIARVLDGGSTETGRPYFVMDLVRGIPITEYCDKNHLSARQRLELFIPVCQAIQHAHQKGIIHRDIKPSNVLVTLHGSVAVPIVIDFGIAKAINQRLTEKTLFTNFAQMIGTPAYMSPEQAEMSGLDIDTRTDLYSLGVLLYELLTGTTPFSSKELMEVGYAGMQRMITQKEPPRPSARLSTMQHAQRTAVAENRKMDVPALTRLFQGDLDWIVMKCLEKDPARRYETANGLAADIQRHIQNEPVTARPPSAAYRFQKGIRRNRVAFATGAIVALSLVFGITVSTWQAVRATKAEREQVRLREGAERATALEAAARQAAVTAGNRAKESDEKAQHELYVAKMNLVRQAWDQNNAPRVAQLLEETAGSPYKGFEWFYWRKQMHPEVMTLRGHKASVVDAAWSADGRIIVTCGIDGVGKVWDARTGRERCTLHGTLGEFSRVAISPDSRRILTTFRSEKGVVLWDADSGDSVLTLQEETFVGCLAFAPDGSRFIMGVGVKEPGSTDLPFAKICDVRTGKELASLKGHTDFVCSAAFSPDGTSVLTGSHDNTAKIWDSITGAMLHSTALSPDAPNVFVAYDPQGRPLVAEYLNHRVDILDVRAGTPWCRFGPVESGERDIVLSIDCRTVAVVSHHETVSLWEVPSGKHLRTVRVDGLPVAAFSPDGSRVVIGEWDFANTNRACAPRVLDIRNAPESPEETNSVLVKAMSPDTTKMLTVGEAGTAQIRTIANGSVVSSFNVGSSRVGEGIFSPNGGRVAVVTTHEATNRHVLGDRVAIYDVTTGAELFLLQPSMTNASIIAYSGDGGTIVTAGVRCPTVKIWDAASGRELYALSPREEGAFNAAFSTDARRLFISRHDHSALIWDTVSRKEVASFPLPQNCVALPTAFSPDGLRIAACGGFARPVIYTIDASTGRPLLTLSGSSGYSRSLCFSPDGKRILTTDAVSMRLWDAERGGEVLTVMLGEDVEGLARFSPDGRRIVFAGCTFDKGHLLKKTLEAATPEEVSRWDEADRQDRARVDAVQASSVHGVDLE